MATHRFYIPVSDWNLENLALSAEEAHHCIDVMRCREGDRVIVFNGEGTEVEAEITGASKKLVELRSLLVGQTNRPPAALTLAASARIPAWTEALEDLSGMEPSDDGCVVCLSEAPTVALVPCGHVSFCDHCADVFGRSDAAQVCPLCRAPIERTLRLFA